MSIISLISSIVSYHGNDGSTVCVNVLSQYERTMIKACKLATISLLQLTLMYAVIKCTQATSINMYI